MENQDIDEQELLFQEFLNEQLIQITFSNGIDKENWSKAKVHPLLLRGKLLFQMEEFRKNQVFHKNLNAQEARFSCLSLIKENFRQCELQAEKNWAQILVSKKGTITIKRKKITKECAVSSRKLSHNRKKQYILEEGKPVPFLIDLGVMTKEGKIVQAKYDKYRQINRFLEFIEDVLPQLKQKEKNRIIDFGCGKSYLTFAMYYYLKELKGYDIQVAGLDLKKEVIDQCRQLSRKYKFDGLDFFYGDIASYQGDGQADMVVTLHACDTATDFALAKAVSWNAKVILSVPCCQHEWNRQMNNSQMQPILQYGLLKERIAALYTDGIRAEILEHCGYRTQILEFIDMEHTPKNLLIRAVKQGKPKNNEKEILEILQFWQVKPTLAALLLPQNSPSQTDEEIEKTTKESD